MLDTLRWLVRESQTWLEITNLIIPEANDSPEEIRRMCQWIAAELGPDVPLHFSAFHPDFKLTDRERHAAGHVAGWPTTSPARPDCVMFIQATFSTPSINTHIVPAAAGR